MAHFRLRLIVPNNDTDLVSQAIADSDIVEHYLATSITTFDSQINQYNNNKATMYNDMVDIDITDSSEDWNTQLINNELNKLNNHRDIYHGDYQDKEVSNSGSKLLNAFTHSVSYTYNEKLQIHKHGQKQLTFDLDDKYLSTEAWELNPYARILHVGTLLELTDKYNNIYLFIITKVAPKFSTLNITYSYTCQDLFSYQLSRQNEGYQLVNDSSSADFIGALNIDEWAERIVQDCYINYQYIPLTVGVLKYTDGTISTFRGEGDINIDGHEFQSVLKPQYNATDNQDFFETFPFSASSSNADAALIALADTLGMQLVTAEGYSLNSSSGDIVYNRYFWFAPSKKADNSGLTYSPKRDIQDFSMSFSGDALTTVLNVSSTTWENEEIGLFPTIPPFFTSYFNNGLWDKSTYYPGLFKEVAMGDHREEWTVDEDDEGINYIRKGPESGLYEFLIPITIPNWPYYYNKLQLYWDNTHYVQFRVSDGNTIINTFNTSFYLTFRKHTPEVGDTDIIAAIGEEISSGLLDSSKYQCYLTFKYPIESITIKSEETPYFYLTRNYTSDELEFAEAAEECPWLENKLIDFTYFLRQNIISGKEYKDIMNFLLNDIRILNGKLMSYANAYFTAIHEQTQTLSSLQTLLDGLGSRFYGEVISSFEKTGDISKNIADFKEQYDSIFFKSVETDKTPLLGLNSLVSDNFNKYLQAEQRFLKNIYEFKKFFNERNCFASSEDAIMETVTYTIQNNITKEDENFYFYSFDDKISYIALSSLDSNTRTALQSGGTENLVDLYKYKNNNYVYQTLATKDTIAKNLIRVPKVEAQTILPLSDSKFSSKAQYYNENFDYLIKKTDYTFFFGNEVPEDRIYTYNSEDYVQLNGIELKQLYLYDNPNKYYWRDTKYRVPFRGDSYDTWTVTMTETQFEDLTACVSTYLLSFLGQLTKYNKRAFNYNSQQNKFYFDLKSMRKTLFSLYRKYMPVDNLYFIDYDLRSNNEGTWNIYDENGNPYQYNNGWKKLNKQTNLYEAIEPEDVYQGFFTIDYNTIGDNNPSLWYTENDSAASAIDVIHIYNEMAHSAQMKYYTCSVNATAHGWATAAAVAGPILFAQPWSLATIVGTLTFFNLKFMRHQFAHWTQEDNPEYTMTYFTNGSWTQQENSNRDTVIPTYLKSADAENTIMSLTESLRGSSWFTDLEMSWKHYYNYFSYIAATYSTEANQDIHFYIYERNASFLTTNDIINKNEQYILVPATLPIVDSGGTTRLYDVCNAADLLDLVKTGAYGTNIDISYTPTRFNTTQLYQLICGKESLDLTNIDFNNKDIISLDDFVAQLNTKGQLGGIGVTLYDTGEKWQSAGSDTGYIIKLEFTVGSTVTSYYIVRLEPYHKVLVDKNNFNKVQQNVLYDINTDEILLNQFEIPFEIEVTGQSNKVIYVRNHDDLDLITIAEKEILDRDWDTNEKLTSNYGHWYLEDNSITHSLYEIWNDNNLLNKYYILSGASTNKQIEFYDSSSADRQFTPTINRFSCKVVDGVILHEKIDSKNFDQNNTIYFPTGIQETTVKYGEDNIVISRVATTDNIGRYTNGTFWYKYHTRNDIPSLQENAAVIEVQLQTHWQVAYNASQYCRWFIPERWQLDSDNANNHFAPYIWNLNSDSNSYQVTVNNLLLPEIAIYQDQLSGIKNKNYNFFYCKNNTPMNYDKSLKPLRDTADLRGNPAVIEVINHLFGEISNNPEDLFMVQEYGTRTYYYVTSGGWLWKDVLNKLSSIAPEIPLYDGLYGMQIRRLINNYVQAETPKYVEYSNKKRALWKQLYTRYPGVFLEKVFSNKDVRSSGQLLQMAKLAMKDYTSPETQYNITTIDIAALSGYNGQELTIGDNILLNTSDYYSDVDEMYRALNQYLFISDISYSLRQDTDIKLTVNTIKYQDKLLQSLVKLIR